MTNTDPPQVYRSDVSVDGITYLFPPGTGLSGGLHKSRPVDLATYKGMVLDVAAAKAALAEMNVSPKPVGSLDPWPEGEVREITPQPLSWVGSLSQANTISFPDRNGNVAVRITVGDPPTIWIDESLAWDAAAKQFWNGVYRVMGKPAPFTG